MAAGRGKRMNNPGKQKVLSDLKGQPLICHTIKSLKRIGIKKPIIVVGIEAEKVKKTLGKSCKYVYQRKRLGTGHAVMKAEKLLKNKNGVCVVVNGDSPFFSIKTLSQMIKKIQDPKTTLVLVTANLGKQFPYGRIIKDKSGNIIKIVEEKNCTSEQRKIRQKNCGCYVFDNLWLWEGVKKLTKNPVSDEYYITDLVEIAAIDGLRVSAVKLARNYEAVGVNTPEDLKLAEKIAKRIRK